jgi:hypothetical protein
MNTKMIALLMVAVAVGTIATVFSTGGLTAIFSPSTRTTTTTTTPSPTTTTPPCYTPVYGTTSNIGIASYHFTNSSVTIKYTCSYDTAQYYLQDNAGNVLSQGTFSGSQLTITGTFQLGNSYTLKTSGDGTMYATPLNY